MFDASQANASMSSLPTPPKKVDQIKTKKQLHDKLIEMARHHGITPIDDISVLQASEAIDDDEFEQEISKLRERHRAAGRSL